MLLFVAVPDRSTTRKICPASPPGLIAAPNRRLPPRLTEVVWSKVGVTAGFCASLERTQKNELPKSPPPMNRLPFLSTSSVPQTGELGMKIGLIQVTPPSVDRLNCLPPQLLPLVLQAWYWKPLPMPPVLSMVNHCLSPPVTSPKLNRVQDSPPVSEPHISSKKVCRRLR